MTIISHRHRFIFLKSRKTAGTSVEKSLLRYLERGDRVATSSECEPVALAPFDTPNRTTPGFPGERLAKRILRRLGHPAMRLREHMPAAALRRLVGEAVWNDSFTFTIERDPWRRLVSLWRWRRDHHGLKVDFEAFLRGLEAGTRKAELAVGGRRWSNVPFYAIDGEIVVDRVLQYDRLVEDLGEACRQIGMEFDGWLPRLKVSAVEGEDPALMLSADQIERIGRLCAREIEWFGYRAPAGAGP